MRSLLYGTSSGLPISSGARFTVGAVGSYHALLPSWVSQNVPFALLQQAPYQHALYNHKTPLLVETHGDAVIESV